MGASDSEGITDGTGHRARLRQRLLTDGDGLLDNELIEYLLALAIPRRDTKPLAKTLIHEFGGIAGLLTADAKAIARVPGMGETSIAALKIAAVIERIGDYAKNIAKRTPLIHASDGERIEAISLLPAMAQMAGDMVHDVLDAFSARDAEAAIRVSERDARLDDFYDSIFRTLVTYMVENPRTISEVAHLLFVAKNIERIGDHATNVAEMVYFAATGQYLADRDTDTAEN